jgi:methionyl-tRNA formyltransferase
MDAPIVFAGTPANAALTLEHLIRGGFRVVLAITRPDAPVGRRHQLTPSPVADMATKYGIETLKTNSIDSQALNIIASSGASLGIVVAYGSLLRAPALEALELGWFNLHYSLLPKWRGAAPVQHSLLNGDLETGVTLFKIDEGMDTGPMVGQVHSAIEPDESAGHLLARLTEIGFTLLSECIPAITAGIAKMTDQTGEASSAPKLKRADALIDWNKSAKQIESLIRGCNPEPGAWTYLAGQPFKITEARAFPDSEALNPGAVQVLDSKVLVGTSLGVLVLKTVQPASKKAMSASDWARGLTKEMSFDQ